LETRQLLSSWSFDFGTAASPVASGYTRVSEASKFATAQGYGWTSSYVQSRDRLKGTELTRDFAMSERGRLSFAASLASGTYDVTLTIGDAEYPKRGQSVWLEGQQVDTVATAVGQFIQKTYRVNVTDGRLDLDLRGVNGNSVVVLNAMTITPAAAEPPTDAVPPLFAEDFEDANLPSRGWYDGSRYAISDDSTTGAHSLQYSFVTGRTSPTEDVARRLFPGTETVYLSFDLKLSPDWVWGAYHNFHLFYFLTNADAPYKGPAATHLTLYVDSLDGRLRLGAQDISNATMPHGMTQGTSTANNGKAYSSSTIDLQPGRWYHVEAMFRLNSLDLANDRPNADGGLWAWVDGRQVVSRTDLVFRTTDFPDMKINQLLIGPYIHGGSRNDQELWIDNLRVGTARPSS
jgi:hypothetical protein